MDLRLKTRQSHPFSYMKHLPLDLIMNRYSNDENNYNNINYSTFLFGAPSS